MKNQFNIMWPFKSVKSISDSGALNGFTDCHSHILPGVDDGIATMEDALAVLSAYEELGVKRVWLTPHIMEDVPNTTAALRSRFEELRKEWTGNIELHLAAENMLDNLFEARLEEKDLLPIGEEGKHLLVETSYYNPPIGMEKMLDKIKSAGYFPVLAHPERYRYMDKKEYQKLKDKGIYFQMNYLSLVGAYGETARAKAEWLLEHAMIDLAGSDVHQLDTVLDWIDESPKKKSHLTALLDVTLNPKLKL